MKSWLQEPGLLIDPDGEGVYLHEDSGPPGVLMQAATILHGSWREWRNVEHTTVYMRPDEAGNWYPASIGKHPRGWRLNLPRRWRPVRYVYCTPKDEAI